jgi:hypothetical protein
MSLEAKMVGRGEGVKGVVLIARPVRDFAQRASAAGMATHDYVTAMVKPSALDWRR